MIVRESPVSVVSSNSASAASTCSAVTAPRAMISCLDVAPRPRVPHRLHAGQPLALALPRLVVDVRAHAGASVVQATGVINPG
jgi:hypothetical protein